MLATLSSEIPSHFNIPLRYRTFGEKPKEPAVMATVPVQDSNLIYPAVSHTVICVVATHEFLSAYCWTHTHSAITMHTIRLAKRRCIAQTYVYEVKTPFIELYYIISISSTSIFGLSFVCMDTTLKYQSHMIASWDGRNKQQWRNKASVGTIVTKFGGK
jgi:hypothetical protein